MKTKTVTGHPLRRAILEVMIHEGGEWSPASLSKRLLDTREFKKTASLGNVSYHMKMLAEARPPAVKLIRKRPVRGALEHFYVPAVGVCPTCEGNGTLSADQLRAMLAEAEAEEEAEAGAETARELAVA